TKSRASSSAKSGTSPSRSAATSACENDRPTTAAAWSAAFSRPGRRSMRPASTACTESGICASSPSIWASSSTKNGLPSVRSRIADSCSGSTSPPRAEQLGSRRGEHEQRCVRLRDEARDEVEQGVLRPVDVLDGYDERPAPGHAVDEREPSLLELLADGERMQVAGDVEPEREPEDSVRAELADDLIGIVTVAQPALRAEQVAEREIGAAAPRRRTPDEKDAGQARGELADESALADAGIAHERHQLRDAVCLAPSVRVEQRGQLTASADERRTLVRARARCRPEQTGDTFGVQIAEVERTTRRG